MLQCQNVITFVIQLKYILSGRGSKSEILNGLGAMNTAIIFMGTATATAVIPVVISERAVYYRERAAGMYSALPYSLEQVLDFSFNPCRITG